MWVIAAGMQRSGSTVQYQIAKHLIEAASAGKALGWFPDEEHANLADRFAGDNSLHLIKSHNKTDFLKERIRNNDALIIYSHRNILDVISSLKKKYKISFTENDLKNTVLRIKQTHLDWMQYEDILIQKYDDILNHLDICIKEIADFIGIDAPPEELQTMASKLSLDAQKDSIAELCQSDSLVHFNENNVFDPESLLHTNHIDSGQIGRHRDNISKAEAELILSIWGRDRA